MSPLCEYDRVRFRISFPNSFRSAISGDRTDGSGSCQDRHGSSARSTESFRGFKHRKITARSACAGYEAVPASPAPSSAGCCLRRAFRALVAMLNRRPGGSLPRHAGIVLRNSGAAASKSQAGISQRFGNSSPDVPRLSTFVRSRKFAPGSRRLSFENDHASE